MRTEGPDGYWVSDDPALLDLDRVQQWISGESYWAKGRPREVMVSAIGNSLNLGLYGPDGTQAGFARLVTDYATFAWLCDVFVDSAHRGHGLGSFLIWQAVDHPAVRDCRQFLATSHDRTVYERFGYATLSDARRWMDRPARGTAG
ncbi:MAG: GNAT family N-acetyltransferase [Actinomycetota bacterium]